MAWIDPDSLRALTTGALTPSEQSIISDAADYIDMLRRQLHEAHSANEDSDRLNWLAQQSHEEYSEPAHRSYFKLPLILKCKHGKTAHNLREAIDMVRKPHQHD